MLATQDSTPHHLTPLRVQNLFVLLLFLVLLQGCSETPVRPDVVTQDPLSQAAHAMQTGDYGRAHNLYMQLAEEQGPPARWQYRFQAALALYQGGLLNQANQLLQDLPHAQLPRDMQMERQLLLAEIALKRDPDLALSLLLQPAVEESLLSGRPDLYAEYHHLRAQAFARLGNHLESAREYLQREMFLSDQASIEDNQLAIWQNLGMLTPQALRQMRYQPPPDALSGWMELAELARNYRLSPAELEALIQRWRQNYPGHPATAAFLDTLRQRSTVLSSRPNDIALLLPLSGRFAAPAQAIQDGVLAAWYADPQRHETRLRIIDVGDDPRHIHAHYQQAVSDGAGMVIGPLDKAAVESLAMQERLPVPTLALNLAAPPLNEQLFQFGLSPEDEAREAANRAWQAGYQRAAVMVPNTALGERMQQAFGDHWQALGGELLAHTSYDPGHNDFAQPIKSLLNIHDSELRYRRINLLSARRVEFTPRLRQDIDFLFLVAQPRQARLIRPQLRFHHAGDLPVLASSHLYAGRIDRDADRDLDGIQFNDMPWTLGADTLSSELRETSRAALNHHSGQLQRFVALGVDAYHLIPLLEMLKRHPHEYYSGETGMLSVDAYGQLSRQLHWAVFRRGSPQLMQEALGEGQDVRANPR
ncbi:MAG: penicillin-binding protein activator [Gammaproteobacteria bacterium]|nr:penicillin-binding protein activator [Gammaproteobacteria bacterium]